MAQEIERKFLLGAKALEAVRKEEFDSQHICQAYLSSTPLCTIRVRRKGDRGYITIKGKSGLDGLSRYEWEKEIPVEDVEDLMVLAAPGAIDKTRHLVRNSDGIHTWEVDEFHGENEGLIVAEIELGSEDEAFDKPSWLGQEVTGDRRYYNSHLICSPYSTWKE